MTYIEFIKQLKPYDNLYNISRITDNKELLRGCNYETVADYYKYISKEIIIYIY